MLDYGLKVFLSEKEVNINNAIDKYLKYKEVKDFKPKNHDKVNQFIQQNWNNFANFIDKSIKNGTLKGKAIKLNTYFDEQREYKQNVAAEFDRENITDLENKLLKRIRNEYSIGFIQSFLMKKNIRPLSKDTGYFSKTLQWLPLVRQAIENGIEEQ